MPMAAILAENIIQTKGMFEKLLSDFSDEEMLFRPAKGANHATWQIGHLINSTWGMMTACAPTMERRIPDDSRYGKSGAVVDDPAKFPKKAELMQTFAQSMEAAAGWAKELSDADLAKPSPERLKNFAATVGNVALLLGTHPMMHLGQLTVMRRALGKPVLF